MVDRQLVDNLPFEPVVAKPWLKPMKHGYNYRTGAQIRHDIDTATWQIFKM